MKNIFVFVLVILVCSSQHSPLKANLFGSTVILKDGVFRIKLGVDGGFPPLFYEFGVIPEKWIHIGEFIFVPEAEVKVPKKFIIRVKILDSLKNKLDFSVILTADGYSMSVEPVVYAYNHVFPP